MKYLLVVLTCVAALGVAACGGASSGSGGGSGTPAPAASGNGGY